MNKTNKKPSEIASIAGLEIHDIANNISESSVNDFMKIINDANRIFITGAGRSLLMLRAFAMRLMHIGYEVFVVGDTTTPAFEKNDLLIVGSGSGETLNLVSITERAKSFGGKIVTLTIFNNSTLAKLSDVILRVPAYTDKIPKSEENKPNILPGGSMFEITMLVLLDSVIVKLAETKSISTDVKFVRHANLE